MLAQTLLSNGISSEKLLNEVLELSSEYLVNLATSERFQSVFKTAFGEKYNALKVERLRQEWKVSNISFPEIKILSATEINGANGAFSNNTNTIYLAQDFLNDNLQNINQITAVFLEEFGHSIDAQINILDTFGDEGNIFSQLLIYGFVDNLNLEKIRMEDDRAIANIDGQVISIEKSEDDFFANLDSNLDLQAGIATTLSIEYGNQGSTDLISPLLTIRADQVLEWQIPGTDQWIVDSSFSLMALSEENQANILRAGESQVLEINIRLPIGTQKPNAFTVYSIAANGTESSAELIDWTQLETSSKLPGISDAGWAAIWNNVQAQTGSIYGDLVNMLGENAAYLAELGESVYTLPELLSFEILQANGLNSDSPLASGVDIAESTTGLSLGFSRVYSEAISARYDEGDLGYGWEHNYNIYLEELADRIVLVHFPNGTFLQFIQDDFGRYQNPNGESIEFIQDVNGNFSLQYPDSLVYTFNSDLKLATIENRNVDNDIVSLTYENGQLAQVIHSSGKHLSFEYNSQGRINLIRNQDNEEILYQYDANGEHLTQITTSDGQTINYDYYATGHGLKSITNITGTQLNYEYDNLGRLSSQYLNVGEQRVDYSYDNAGTVTITNAENQASQLFYNQQGIVVGAKDSLNRDYKFNFNANGSVTETILPNGQTITTEYDVFGNPTSTSNSLGNRINVKFNSDLGNLEWIEDGNGNRISYSYDELGNPSSINYVDGSSETFQVDNQGNLTQYTNRRGQSTSYSYNAEGQIAQEDSSNGSSVTYTYDTEDRLTSITNSQGVLGFTYTEKNEIARIDYADGRFVQFNYNGVGRRTRLEASGGYAVNYSYDAIGRLSQLTDGNNQLIVQYSYDEIGRLQREDKGNGTYTIYEYFADNQLKKLVHYDADAAINSSFSYTYNDLGQQTGVITLDGEWSYGYDGSGQLVTAIFNSTNPDIDNQNLTYIYDAAGNRVRTIQNGVTTDYSANNLNQYQTVGEIVYDYDDDGNLISKTEAGETWSYDYNQEGRLIKVTDSDNNITDYEYDALGNRIATVYNGERTEYLVDPFGFGNVIGEYDSNGDLVANYTHGIGLESRIDGDNSEAYFDFNHLGSTIGLTDASGNSYLNRYTYLPFGQELLETETVSNSFEFVGQWGITEEANGLDYMRARYYDSSLGRFTSPDPIGLNGGDTNLYRYVGNNPSNLIDPEGEAWFIPLVIFAGGGLVSTGIYSGTQFLTGDKITKGGLTGSFISGGLFTVFAPLVIAGSTAAGGPVGTYLGVGLLGGVTSLISDTIEQSVDQKTLSNSEVLINSGTSFFLGPLGNKLRLPKSLIRKFRRFKSPKIPQFFRNKFKDTIGNFEKNIGGNIEETFEGAINEFPKDLSFSTIQKALSDFLKKHIPGDAQSTSIVTNPLIDQIVIIEPGVLDYYLNEAHSLSDIYVQEPIENTNITQVQVFSTVEGRIAGEELDGTYLAPSGNNDSLFTPLVESSRYIDFESLSKVGEDDASNADNTNFNFERYFGDQPISDTFWLDDLAIAGSGYGGSSFLHTNTGGSISTEIAGNISDSVSWANLDMRENPANTFRYDILDTSSYSDALGQSLTNFLNGNNSAYSGSPAIAQGQTAQINANALAAIDPLIIDLNGNGIKLVAFEDSTVSFDSDNDGYAELTGWVSPGDVMVVHDLDNNGTIDGIHETISEYYTMPSGAGQHPDFADGLDALVSLDSNQDSWFDSLDVAWTTLKLWQDRNQNGYSEADELLTFEEAGIQKISTEKQILDREFSAGNPVFALSHAVTTKGLVREVAAVGFTTNPLGYEWNIVDDGLRFATENNETSSYVIGTEIGQTISTTAFNVQSIYGNRGDDTLIGDTGDNWLIGGPGSDTFNAGAGDDFLFVDIYDAPENIDGGDGIDIVYATGFFGMTFSMGDANVEVFNGGSGHDLVYGNSVGNVFVRGGGGNDMIFGGVADDALAGEDGDDVIDGNYGDDVIRGHRGDDRLYGNFGDDYLDGGLGDDILEGEAGNDVIIGSKGNDIINGGDGFDLLEYKEKYDQYITRLTATGFEVESLIDGSIDQVTNIEKLRFGNLNLNLSDLNNTIPLAVDDIITVSSNVPFIIFAEDILANDFDLDGDPLHIHSISDAVGGTATLLPNGNIQFTPSPNYFGTWSFDYVVADIDGTYTQVYKEIDPNNKVPLTAQVSLKKANTPDDPLFYSQWYLNEINVLDVWKDYTGEGISIAVFEEDIDKALDHTHPDLNDNISFTHKQNYAPNLVEQFSPHTTLVAGVIAAERNDIGSIGIAHNASLTGHSWQPDNDIGIRRLLDYDVANNSWGYVEKFADSEFNLTNGSLLIQLNAIDNAAHYGRNGLGTIVVQAGGNERESGDSTNFHALTNSRFTIATGSINNAEDLSKLILATTPFSNPGTSILVSAPGSNIQSTSTILENSNGSTFGNDYFVTEGTSFATPIVSGSAALALEANPYLGYRDLQTLMVYSSRLVNDPETTWIYNGAKNKNGGGLHFSEDYGAGIVDVHALVRLAETWTEINNTVNESVYSSKGTFNAQFSNFANHEIIIDITPTTERLKNSIEIEYIEVSTSITHNRLEDISIELISPDGTISTLLNQPQIEEHTGNLTFTFATTHHFGEVLNTNSTWQLKVKDKVAGIDGTLDWVELKFYGKAQDENDTYIFTSELNQNTLLTDLIGEHDALNAATLVTDSTINLNPGTVSYLNDHEVTITTNTVIEHAFAGDGNDTLIGNSADNQLYGGRGNDIYTGGAGKDIFKIKQAQGSTDNITDFNLSQDKIDLTDFNFLEFAQLQISQSDSNTVVYLGDDQKLILENIDPILLDEFHFNGFLDQTVIQIATNNVPSNLYGDERDDHLIGSENNDYLSGETGNNILQGGLGQDTYFIEINPNHTDIIDDSTIGLWNNRIVLTQFKDLETFDDLNIIQVGEDAQIFLAKNQVILIKNISVTKLSKENFIFYKQVLGSDESNYLIGRRKPDIILGETGNDLIYGREDNDFLAGGDGNDQLYGEQGNDVLDGGNGINDLYGGAGSDQFVISTTQGWVHYIHDFDFSDPNEQIVIDANTGIRRFDQLYVQDIQVNDTPFDFYYFAKEDGGILNATVVDLKGTTATDLSEEQFIFSERLSEYSDQIVKDQDSLVSDRQIRFFATGSILGAGTFNIGSESNPFDPDSNAIAVQTDSTLVRDFNDLIMEQVEEDTHITFSTGAVLILRSADLQKFTADNFIFFNYSSPSKNKIYGFGGNDLIEGDGGNDILYGDQGNDHLLGGDDHDQLYGGDGDDLLKGQTGDDRLYGENGNDNLSGGFGNDLLEGGLGDDNYYIHSSDFGHDTIFDLRGNDKLIFEAISSQQILTKQEDFNLLLGLDINRSGDWGQVNNTIQIQDWFTNDNHKIELIHFNQDNENWSSSQLESRLFSPPPMTANDFFTTDEDTRLTISTSDLLINDHDVNNSNLEIISIGKVTNGNVNFDQNNNDITFIPNAHFNGEAFFEYLVQNKNGDTSIGQVNIDVHAVDDAPIVMNPLDNITVEEGTNNTTINLDRLFSDVDNDNMAIALSIGGNTNPSLITATIENRQLILDHHHNQNGITDITIVGDSNGQIVEDTLRVTIVGSPEWTLDIDGNGSIDAFSDGMMTIRYLFGSVFSGSALIEGIIAPDATRNEAEIRAYLQEGLEKKFLDIDGSGSIGVFSDGIIMMRYLSGSIFSGQALIDGVIHSDASRDLSSIQNYLADLTYL